MFVIRDQDSLEEKRCTNKKGKILHNGSELEILGTYDFENMTVTENYHLTMPVSSLI